MKQITLSALLFALTLCIDLSAQDKKLMSYKIEIKESGMFFDNIFAITKDSIIANKHTIMGDINLQNKYIKILTIKEQEAVTEILIKTDLSKIEKKYVNNKAPDDLMEYDFQITIDSQIKEFHIYCFRVDEVLSFVKKINGLLPADYQIGYNDQYLSWEK